MKPLLYFFAKLHRYAGKTLYLNLLVSMLVGLLDGVGILLLVPLLSIIGMVELPIDHIPGLHLLAPLQELPRETALLVILGMYIVVVVGHSFIARNVSLREIRIHTGYINHLRLEVYRSLLKANWSFLMKQRKSDLIHSLTGELGRVTSSTFTFLQLLASIVFTAIQIGLAMVISFPMTLYVLGCGLLIAAVSRRYIKKSGELGMTMSELAQSYLAGITDHFNGIKDIKSNLLERSRYRWLAEWSDQAARERYENAKVRSNSRIVYKVFSTLMIAGFIFGSVSLFQSQGMSLLLIAVIFSRLWPRFTGIQSSLENIAGSVPALQALMELQKRSEKAQDVQGLMDVEGAAAAPIRIEDHLECRDVYFKYEPEQSGHTLEAIQLSIPVHRMTAIIGQSGAGKSTLIDIIMGLMKPASGKLLIDGKELTDADLLSLRSSISYVPQDPFLFHGSIRENLSIVDPAANEEQMWEALEFSSAAEFVRKLPQGLDTVIGDRGIRLSGGERQRLVLARAIVRKPSILILDEATSSLDTMNESKIQEAIDRLKGSMTVIVIAHRLTTIRNADQVVVLDQGKIVQVRKNTKAG